MTTQTALQMAAAWQTGSKSLTEIKKAAWAKINTDTHQAFLRSAQENSEQKGGQPAPAADAGPDPGFPYPSPLAGAGVALADNILIKDKIGTAASRMLHSFRPPYGATVVDKLLAAGLWIAGMTNLPEFGMGTAGSDAYFGPIRHPLDPDRVSEGAACAVALGLAPLALSVDSTGNPRKQAAMAGVLCLKPSYGLISRFGLIPYVESTETVAITATTMADAAALLAVVAGYDEKDGTTYAPGTLSLPEAEGAAGIAGWRIALPQEYFTDDVDPQVRQLIDDFCRRLEAAGARLCPVSLPIANSAHLALQAMAAAEGANNISRYDGIKYGYQSPTNRTIEEIYFCSRSEGFQAEAKATAMLGAHLLAHGQYEPYYLKALQIRRLAFNQVKEIFQNHDLILTPPARGYAYPVKPTSAYAQDNWADSKYTALASLTGIPATVLPVGLGAGGLPAGVQLMADTLQEGKLIRLALACGL